MRHIAVLLISISLISAKSASASACTDDPVLQDSLRPTEQWLSNPHYNIVVGRIVQLKADGEGTNGMPPAGLLRVDTVLRGHLKPGVYEAVWQGALRNSDLVDPKNYKFDVKPEWRDCLLSAPPAGTDIIAFVQITDGGSRLSVTETAVFRDTALNRSVARQNAAPAEREGRLQVLLFLALMALPIAGLVVVFTKLKWLGALLSVSELPLYMYYESGISIYSNIRIDLLLIWPALGLAAINVVIFVIRHLYSQRRSAREA